MKRLILMISGILATLTLSKSVCAQETVIADKVIAVVGNSAILYTDLLQAVDQIKAQQRQERYTPDRDPMSEAMELLLMQKLLSNQARLDSLEINSSAIAGEVENRVNQLVERLGSISKLEAMFNKPIFLIKSDLQAQYEDSFYAEAMRNDVESKVTVTPSEVERFFKTLDKDQLPMIPEQYCYSHIVKFPPDLKEAQYRTRERLLALRERIIKGETFAMLARLYSEDPGTSSYGGELAAANPNQYVQPFAEALTKLKPGQVSSVVETEYGFHIIQLIDKKGELYHCRHILMKPSFTTEEMERSKVLLDSIANLVKCDSMSFAAAAIRFSEDKLSKMNGGRVSNHELLKAQHINNAKATTIKFFKEELGNDYYAIKDLKVGDISAPFETTDLSGNTMTKIIRLDKIIPQHVADLNEDYLRIEEVALNDKKNRTFNKWVEEKIKTMYIRIDPEYRDLDYKYKGWVKK